MLLWVIEQQSTGAAAAAKGANALEKCYMHGVGRDLWHILSVWYILGGAGQVGKLYAGVAGRTASNISLHLMPPLWCHLGFTATSTTE